MGRIRRVIAVALGAALLGLAASVLVGAHVRQWIATATLADAPVGPKGANAMRDARPPNAVAVAGEAGSGKCAVASGAAVSPGPAKRRKGRSGRVPASAAARDGFLDELERGITKLGEHRYQIKSSALALALANLGALGQAVRVAPEARDGNAFGFRLAWVEPDGPIARLGLRTGDVLVSVNGFDLATPDQVLDAYGKLEAARLLVLGFVRDGRRSAVEYAIR